MTHPSSELNDTIIKSNGRGAKNLINVYTWQQWKRELTSLGFAEIKAAPVHFVTQHQTVKNWVAQGHHAQMDWYARNLEKRFDPKRIMPEAKSIVMLTASYQPEPAFLGPFKIARYAAGSDYHDILKKKLMQFFQEKGPQEQANFRVYVDTGPVLERYWAQEAGLGWIGKNGNLISRTHGSYIFLCAVIIDKEVPYGSKHLDFCGTCRACIDACPTQAIKEDRTVDSRQCISYLNIEHRGPFEDAPPFENWIFGCDICQEVCPWNKFAKPLKIQEFSWRQDYDLPQEKLRKVEIEEFRTLFRKSPIKRTKLDGILRNLEHLEQFQGETIPHLGIIEQPRQTL